MLHTGCIPPAAKPAEKVTELAEFKEALKDNYGRSVDDKQATAITTEIVRQLMSAGKNVSEAEIGEIFKKVAELNTILDKYDIEVKFDWNEYFTLLGQCLDGTPYFI